MDVLGLFRMIDRIGDPTGLNSATYHFIIFRGSIAFTNGSHEYSDQEMVRRSNCGRNRYNPKLNSCIIADNTTDRGQYALH